MVILFFLVLSYSVIMAVLKDLIEYQGSMALIRNFLGEEINISDSFRELDGKELIIENCSNLKAIEASNCGLVDLFIDECPKLEYLEVYNNNLEELDVADNASLKFVRANYNKLESVDVSGCENLLELECAGTKYFSRIKELDLTDCKKLKKLVCYHNSIKELEVKHLKNCNVRTIICKN